MTSVGLHLFVSPCTAHVSRLSQRPAPAPVRAGRGGGAMPRLPLDIEDLWNVFQLTVLDSSTTQEVLKHIKEGHKVAEAAVFAIQNVSADSRIVSARSVLDFGLVIKVIHVCSSCLSAAVQAGSTRTQDCLQHLMSSEPHAHHSDC